MSTNARTVAFGVEPSRRRYRLRLARYQALGERIAQICKSRDDAGGAKVQLLDVGVGNGRSYRYAEPHGVTENIQFAGMDLSPRRLAKVYGGERWELTFGNVEEGLPYADGRFDVVICEQVMEHLHDPGRALHEMARVLRPGGTLIAGVPIFSRPGAWMRRTLMPWLTRYCGVKTDHLQSFSLRSFVRLLERRPEMSIADVCGFRIVSGGVVAFLEDYRWWWKLNRAVGKAVPGMCTEVQVTARKMAVAA